MKRGAIADDFTGATDLAGNWRARGLRTAVLLGVPQGDNATDLEDYDALVVALKTRAVDRDIAVRQARSVAEFLRGAGCEQIYDKYCSTFDSTPQGNIGPVADELMEVTGSRHAVVVPAFPDNARTVYKGHLFVGDQPLDESPMKDHPLNPMRDSSVVRLLQAQSRHTVGLVPLETVRAGSDALREAFAAQEAKGCPLIVVDAIDNSDLSTISAATTRDALVTGGSGLALGLEQRHHTPEPLSSVSGHRAVLSGSASTATRAQVAHARGRMAHRQLDLHRCVADTAGEVEHLAEWARREWAARPDEPVMVYSVGDPQDIARGRRVSQSASLIVERVFSQLAVAMSRAGASQFIVAGGETSGSVLEGLDVKRLVVGDLLSPGVSWLAGFSSDGREYNFVLKSGNFGTDDLFEAAWGELA